MTHTVQSGSHKSWHFWYEYPPIPLRTFDWCAVPDDYDGAPDANDHRILYASTREGIRKEIDSWIQENELHREEL